MPLASQAKSASSILVTRSTKKAQVRDPGLFAVRGDQRSRARFVPPLRGLAGAGHEVLSLAPVSAARVLPVCRAGIVTGPLRAAAVVLAEEKLDRAARATWINEPRLAG
ncbi:hypothetical protein SAFG77S_06358 [Streptomyces afghaniensis]